MAEDNSSSKRDADIDDEGTDSAQSHDNVAGVNAARDTKDALMAEGMHQLSVNKDSGVSLQSSTAEDASSDDPAQIRRMFGKPPSSERMQAIRRRRHDDAPDEKDEESSSLGFFDMDAEETSLRTTEGQVEDEVRSNVAADEEEVAEETSASSSDNDMVAAESKQFDTTYARPPHRWAVLKAVQNREYGDKQHRNYQDSFRYRAMGSLHVVERFELMYKLDRHEGCVNCLNFNASGTRLLSGSDDTQVVMWDWAANEPLLSFDSGHHANVFQAKFLPLMGDCHVVTCARDGQIRSAELSVTGNCRGTRKLAQHRGSAHKLSVDIDSPHTFLSCGEDAAVFQVDIRDPKPTKLLICKAETGGELAKVPLYSISNSPANPYLFATSGRDQWVRVYDKRRGGGDDPQPLQPVQKFCPDHLKNESVALKTNVTCVVHSHDGSELLASYNDEDIYIFDANHSDGADFVKRFRGHRNNATVKGVNYYGPNSEFVVSGSDDGYIYFWEKQSQAIVHFAAGDEGGVVNCLEPHPTCPVLATSGLDNDVKIWVPSCENPTFDAGKLRKLIRSNYKEREAERRLPNNDMTIFDSHQLWMLLQRAARQARGARDDDDDEETTEGEDHDSDDDTDAENSRSGLICRTS